MIIKKFQGSTEQEAIKLAMQELGPDAIVTNVKKIIPKGINRLFKKTTYEIIAALDETPPKTELSRKESLRAMFKDSPDIIFDEEEDKTAGNKSADPSNGNTAAAGKITSTADLELKLNNLTTMLEKRIGEGSGQLAPEPSKQEEIQDERNVSCIRLVYNQLVDNEVDERYINQIINEIEPSMKKDAPVENIISAIYQKIVLKLGKTEVLDVTPGKVKYVFFIGPTGVGKTTTIAKLASKLKLDKKLKVGLMTADTYRIAAVEQLHTYANILNVPLKVVYNEAELRAAREEFKNYDIVLVDTAGRSHRDRNQRDDLERLVDAIPENEREIFLVLSVTTKYKDLIAITEAYSEISSYRLIFTKLDETSCYGNIFNIRLLTGAPLSYATFGQQVPTDISRIDEQVIARHLLGSND